MLQERDKSGLPRAVGGARWGNEGRDVKNFNANNIHSQPISRSNYGGGQEARLNLNVSLAYRLLGRQTSLRAKMDAVSTGHRHLPFSKHGAYLRLCGLAHSSWRGQEERVGGIGRTARCVP